MSFVSASERPESPTASLSDDSLEFTRHFTVIMSSLTDDVIDVLSCGDLPDYRSAYTFGSFNGTPVVGIATQCDSHRAAPGSLAWIVNIGYSLPKTEHQQSPDQQGQDPTLDAPVIRLSTESEDIELVKVWQSDGAGGFEQFEMLNFAGDKFDPVPVRRRTYPVIELTRNEPSATDVDELVRIYADSICIPTEEVFGRLQARCRSINVEKVFRLQPAATGGWLEAWDYYTYYKVSYAFEFRGGLEVLEAGEIYIDAADGKRKYFKSEGRSRVGLLKANGDALNKALGADLMGTYRPGYAEEPEYTAPMYETEPISYAPLNLPASIADCQAAIDLRPR